MKKLLFILLSVMMVCSAFTACSNNNPSAVNETTAKVTKAEIETGIIKGGSYTNKSLGFKVIKPDNLDNQSYGDLDLSPENADFEFPDYYLIDNHYKGKSEKFFQIEILGNKFDSLKSWKNSITDADKNAKTKDKMIIGKYEYTIIESGKKVYFTSYNYEKLVLMTFQNFSYNDAKSFIEQNFESA